MALVSNEEPVKLLRFEPTYKANVAVPIDVSGIFLEDATPVLVQVFFQNDPETSQPFPLQPFPLVAGVWSTIKKKPGDVPVLKFTPPVPGTYTVVLVGVTTPAFSVWKCAPITVQA